MTPNLISNDKHFNVLKTIVFPNISLIKLDAFEDLFLRSVGEPSDDLWQLCDYIPDWEIHKMQIDKQYFVQYTEGSPKPIKTPNLPEINAAHCQNPKYLPPIASYVFEVAIFFLQSYRA